MGLENPIHILIILAVVLMVFGAKRLPEMGRGLGDGMRGFKEAISGNTPAGQTLSPAPAAAVSSEPKLDPMVTTPEVVTPVVVSE